MSVASAQVTGPTHLPVQARQVLALCAVSLAFNRTLPASPTLLRKLLSRVLWEWLRVLQKAAGMAEVNSCLLSSDQGHWMPTVPACTHSLKEHSSPLFVGKRWSVSRLVQSQTAGEGQSSYPDSLICFLG